MRTFIILIRDTETGQLRRIQMHGNSASEISERVTATIGPTDVISEIRWND